MNKMCFLLLSAKRKEKKSLNKDIIQNTPSNPKSPIVSYDLALSYETGSGKQDVYLGSIRLNTPSEQEFVFDYVRRDGSGKQDVILERTGSSKQDVVIERNVSEGYLGDQSNEGTMQL